MSKSATVAASLVMGLGLACSSTPGGGRGEQGIVRGQPIVIENSRATFAASGSDQIARAALQYPAWSQAELEPPISLTASDGTGLRMTSLEAKAVIDGPLAFTELHLSFTNPHNRVIEGRFAITLPEEAAISRMAMKIDGRWQEAEVVEKQLARRAYEDFLHRRQDPALLEKQAGNAFRARIFPIPAKGSKEIIVAFSHELAQTHEAYRLPLRGLPAIDSLKITALRGTGAPGAPMAYEATSFVRTSYKPTKDFVLAQAATLRGITAQELAVVRIAPNLGSTDAPLSRARILFDTSASRAPGFSRQVARFGELVSALAAKQVGLDIDVIAFDSSSARIYRGPAASFGKAQLDALRARRPLGASDLQGALASLTTADARERLILITDSIATAGATEASEFSKILQGLPKLERVDVVLVGGIRDAETARALAVGAVAKAGVVLDGELNIGELARRLGQNTVSGITVAVAGAEHVWPTRLDGVQPGDEVLIYIGMSKPGRSVELRLGGPISQTLRVPLATAPRPLLARALARATIASLTADRDALAVGAKAERAALKARIVELSSRHRVLSNFTALLVLETDADYQRFGIDRKALAGILAVGPEGVTIENRADAVVIAKPPVKKRPRKLSAKDGKKKGESVESSYDFAEGRVGGKEGERDKGRFASRDDDDDEDDDAQGGEVEEAKRDDGFTTGLPADPNAPPPPPAEGNQDSTQTLAEAPVNDVATRPHRFGERPPAASESSSDSTGVEIDGVNSRRHVTRHNSRSRPQAEVEPEPTGPPALSGKLAKIMKLITDGKTDRAVVQALAWRNEDSGDVMALIALGEALEARGQVALAVRVYGSIIDLFPSRADMRRMAAQRLERLDKPGAPLAADALAKAAAQRPDHLTGHRQLAYALIRAGRYGDAFTAIETGLNTRYPAGRFGGGARILREDLGIIGAAWIAREPSVRAEVIKRLGAVKAELATEPSTRFVLSWETDANDVDFHIYDAKGNHAFFQQMKLASGGELYHDVTNGYGPECFAISGPATAGPYRVRIHYYSRGPMGYGMGELEILEHDGKGTLSLESRPFVVMNDGAYVELGKVQ